MPPGISSRDERLAVDCLRAPASRTQSLIDVSPRSAKRPAGDLLGGLVEVDEVADGVRDVDRRREVRRQLARQDQDQALLLPHAHRSREAYAFAGAPW